jgi:urea transport system permease protein
MIEALWRIITRRVRNGHAISVFCLLLMWVSLAAAQGSGEKLGASLDRLLANSFEETSAAITEIAATGDERATFILEALADRRLSIDPASRMILVTGPDGSVTDARTGAAVATPPTGAALVRINNRLRGAIASVLGSLTLSSFDPARRLQAANDVFKSRKVEALPGLDAALAREQDPAIGRALAEARAAILIGQPSTSPADAVAAIATLSGRGDQDAFSLLRGLADTSTTAEIKAAAATAIAGLEQRRAVLDTTQNVIYGLSLGSVLLLAAIGLAITFGVMGVINMAHGEMVMLGAYTTFVVQELFRAYAPGLLGWSLAVAIPLAFLVSAFVGAGVERLIIRHLYGRPLETLLATFGVSLMLQQAVRTGFGPTNREVASPAFMSGTVQLLGINLTAGRLWIIVFSLIIFVALLLMLRGTSLGLQMRAVTQNRRMASSMGIRTGFVDMMTFALGSGIAGMAGVALSQIDNVSPNLGQGYLIDSFMVVVFGGVGNLWGTLVSAFALGIANKLLEPVAGAVLGKILILVLLILFIQKRPRGLFALKGRAVEA